MIWVGVCSILVLLFLAWLALRIRQYNRQYKAWVKEVEDDTLRKSELWTALSDQERLFFIKNGWNGFNYVRPELGHPKNDPPPSPTSSFPISRGRDGRK